MQSWVTVAVVGKGRSREQRLQVVGTVAVVGNGCSRGQGEQRSQSWAPVAVVGTVAVVGNSRGHGYSSRQQSQVMKT